MEKKEKMIPAKSERKREKSAGKLNQGKDLFIYMLLNVSLTALSHLKTSHTASHKKQKRP